VGKGGMGVGGGGRAWAAGEVAVQARAMAARVSAQQGSCVPEGSYARHGEMSRPHDARSVGSASQALPSQSVYLVPCHEKVAPR